MFVVFGWIAITLMLLGSVTAILTRPKDQFGTMIAAVIVSLFYSFTIFGLILGQS